MILKKIKLVNYRNLVKQEIDFSKKINIFIGDNAQGKTNILESIYFLALTKSYRTNDNNLINKNSLSLKVKGDIKDNDIFKTLTIFSIPIHTITLYHKMRLKTNKKRINLFFLH